ncbi:Leucine rich repeat protein [Spraguea lophii 42_110]|uniref:Leucine rich repeat protein n=1 Tax=Spraguea lophii (strain 42_110) TaxID=1358809 RepID=S7XSW6_SPRLO|nr:Leucine rich repeat protein [Spraguea lophii 42_110]
MDMTRFPLPMLKYLDLSKNCIIEFDISNLKNLKILNLSYNRLEEIPSNFTMLENLKELILDSNLFITLPEILFRLKSLSFLSLNCNEIKDLTNLIENDTLEIISLNFNRFSVIDSTILKLKKLRKLYIISSYIIIVPEELRKMGISVITKI